MVCSQIPLFLVTISQLDNLKINFLTHQIAKMRGKPSTLKSKKRQGKENQNKSRGGGWEYVEGTTCKPAQSILIIRKQLSNLKFSFSTMIITMVIVQVMWDTTTKVTLFSLSQTKVQVPWPAATSTVAVVSACKLNTQNACCKAQGPSWKKEIGMWDCKCRMKKYNGWTNLTPSWSYPLIIWAWTLLPYFFQDKGLNSKNGEFITAELAQTDSNKILSCF